MSKHYLNYVEFYITNVCNLNCPNCNRFNNFHFKGHSKWADNHDQYKSWAEILDIKTIGILGGEPLLNPDFKNWLVGLSELWPHSKIRITTNGTMLKKIKNLYQLLTSVDNPVLMSVGCHNLSLKDAYEQDIKDIMGSSYHIEKHFPYDKDGTIWRNSYNSVKDETWPECDTPGEFDMLPEKIKQECETIHGVSHKIYRLNHEYIEIYNDDLRVKLYPQHQFVNTTVIYDSPTQTLSLNKSDPEKAMEICMFKKCHHFIDGKLYKCGPVGLLPEFVKQFNVKRDKEQDQLIHSYKAATPDWTKEELEKFIQGLQNADTIPQCSLCPDKFVETEFSATTDKIKFIQID